MIFKNIPVPSAVRKRTSNRTLAVIGLGFLAVSFVVPLLILSYTSLNLEGGGVLQNYRTAFSGIYLSAIVRSFYYGTITTFISLILAYTLAYYIVFHSKYKFFLLSLVVLPFWVAYIIRYLGVQLFLSPSGPVVILFGTNFGLLFSSLGVIIGLTSALMPFAVLPIYNSLNSIDESFIQASRVMGAGRARTLISVIFPLSLSGIVAGGLIEFILATGSFLAPAVLGGPDQTMIANIIQITYSQSFNIELAAAIAILYTVILTAVLMIFNSVVDIGEVLGNL